ncbi:2-methyl-6-phytyl-1,4-hydroquinone methyltransferase, chloroplastic-like isoform X2 [Phalaenopsis equestris]|uniref:2-methyl-6-phytyl-1,4-hydroquinone methyltransferase, chloroplastic-like isoform X2 n=1 Tax=Phalaenopsis equestris TaxID=78828 RepID=UPI0009E62EB4|nr:2-methyl-6-phytyl-1,4-hydroquinone methyltransferase, chloroplastic-like isoform X2 [Phalaenopsis equestris]
MNPAHWTEDTRDEALEPADLNDSRMKVVDVGGGTGFTTLGIIKHINPNNVTILEQSPHQLAKARQKEALKECTIIEGDEEDLPFPTDSVDRYVSAGRRSLISALALKDKLINSCSTRTLARPTSLGRMQRRYWT